MKTLYEFLVKQHITKQFQYEIANVIATSGRFKRTYIILTKENKDEFIKDIKCINYSNIDIKEIIRIIDDFFNTYADDYEDCICIRPKYNQKGFVHIYRKYDDIKSDVIDNISIENFTPEYWETNYKEIKLK